MTDRILIIVVIALILLAYGVVGKMDYEDELARAEYYAEWGRR